MYSQMQELPARAWRKRQVVLAVENCTLFTFAMTVPFGQGVSQEQLAQSLATEAPALDWAMDGPWDGVELAGFNASMGRLCRFAVARAPQGFVAPACDVAWPVEAGLLGEAESLMLGTLPDAPGESCENLVWVLWRGGRLVVLVCREGKPLHWLCEEPWANAEGLVERLKRFASFMERDPLLGGGPLRWFLSGDGEPQVLQDVASALGASVRSCDLRRGLFQLETSSLARWVPNVAQRTPAAHRVARWRFGYRVAIASLVAMLLVTVASLAVLYNNSQVRSQWAALRLEATESLTAQAREDSLRASLRGQAQKLADVEPIVRPAWPAGPWLSAFGAALPEGARVEQISVEGRETGYGVVVLLAVREFSQADALAKSLAGVPGVRAVRVGDKKTSAQGVRFRLEVDL